jgi:hypothetical protein
LGNSVPFLPDDTWYNLPVARADSGPNKGLAYLRDPLPTIEHSIYLHPGLYNDPRLPLSVPQLWHLDQNGIPTGSCTSGVFTTLVPFAENHEGVSQAALSHWGVTNGFYQNHSDAQDRLDRVYTSGDDDQLRSAVNHEFVAIHEAGPHKSQHHAFDAAEQAKLPIVMDGCHLDHNPTDP